LTKPLNSGIREFKANIIFDENYNITGRAKKVCATGKTIYIKGISKPILR